MNKKNIIITSILIILIMSYVIYYFYRQSEVKIIPEKNFYVKIEDETDLRKIAMKWVKEYTNQYTQEFIKRSKKLTEIEIKTVEILDEENKIVQVDFTAKKASTKTTFFIDENWGPEDNGKIKAQWVINLLIQKNYEDGDICFVTQRRLPAAYDLEQYIASGEAEREYYESNQTEENIKEIEFTEEDYKKANNLEDEENIIIDLLYSELIDEKNGYAVICLDQAMGAMYIEIYKTDDAGESWKIVGNGPSKGYSIRRGSEFKFINQNLGFIVAKSIDKSTLFKTEDGGKNYTKVELPQGQFKSRLDGDNSEWFEIYDTPEMPYLNENGEFILVVGQGSDGDYQGGIKAAYKSTDMGKTWEFIEEFKPVSKEDG